MFPLVCDVSPIILATTVDRANRFSLLQSVEQQTDPNLEWYCLFTIPKPPTANR